MQRRVSPSPLSHAAAFFPLHARQFGMSENATSDGALVKLLGRPGERENTA
jgi:hypothetical protein